MRQCPPAATLRDRIYQVLGERPDLIELFRESAGIRVSGFVAALAEQGPVRGPQHVFVNRRIVRDRSLPHAITDAYSTATIRERSPEVHLFLELAPDASTSTCTRPRPRSGSSSRGWCTRSCGER